MTPDFPPPPPRIVHVKEGAVAGSGDDLNVDKVKAALRRQRLEAGQTPPAGTESPECLPAITTALSDEFSPEKAKAMLKQTRACAIKNAQSSEMLKEAQGSTPGRGIQTAKFRTRGASPPSGAMQAPTSDAKQKKEKS